MSGRRQSSLSETADVPNGSKKKIAAKNHEARNRVIPLFRFDCDHFGSDIR